MLSFPTQRSAALLPMKYLLVLALLVAVGLVAGHRRAPSLGAPAAHPALAPIIVRKPSWATKRPKVVHQLSPAQQAFLRATMQPAHNQRPE